MKKLTFLVLSTQLFILACVQYDPAKLDNLHNEVKVIGHAGSGFHHWFPFHPIPANSKRSILKALESGVAGIEVDVHMTEDNDFVLFHDATLEENTELSGCPSDYSLKELTNQPYSLGIPFDWFQQEKVWSLKALVYLLKEQGSKHEIHLDIRDFSVCQYPEWNEGWAQKLVMELDKKLRYWNYPADKIYLISYSRALVQSAIEQKLPCKISYEITGDISDGISWMESNQITSLTIKPKLLTQKLSKDLHQKNIEIIIFGGKSKRGNANLLELNPDYIQSNNVEALNELLTQTEKY